MKRYPGVSPFTAEQQNIFFGRNNDIDKLTKLISLRKQVLLYSKSGIGKTSLLNAGVLPKLEDKLQIVKVRFFAYSKENTQTPTQRIIDAVKSNFPDFDKQTNTILSEITSDLQIEKSLWYHFKNIELSEKQKFLIVFDQFEELFSYPAEQIEEFKQQFYELTNIDIPDNIMQLIGEKPEFEEHEQIDELYAPLTVKTIFAIRSDRLSLLNTLTDKIHDIQKVFYELNPLDLEQAKQAIVNPAKDKTQDKFDTLPFEFSEKAIDKILYSLSDNEKQSIETTQLQIVCQQIESIVQEKQENTLKNKVIAIEVNDLPDFKDIFLNFYEETVKQTTQPNEARKFIEDQLIRSNQRISLDAIICKDYVNNETLQKLVNAHLLRAERNSTGGFSYELSHDTLIEPIQSVANIRRQKEEEQEKLRIKNEELRINREKQNRQRRVILIVSIAAILSIAFGIFGFVMWQKANDSIKRLLAKDAYNFYNEERFRAAKSKYEELINYADTTEAIQKRIKECIYLDSISNVFYINLNKADSLILKTDVHSIKSGFDYYIQAKSLDYPFSEKYFDKFHIKLKQSVKYLKERFIENYNAGGAGMEIASEIIKVLQHVAPKDNEVDKFSKMIEKCE